MTLANGTKLGPYEIGAPLGAGGMGEVYRARDTRLDRTVAIKVLPAQLADTPDARQRFEREARAVSALNHPHICTLHDVGSQDGVDYLVMEYIEGETLAVRLEKGALPLDSALKIGIEVADALDKAHRAGIIHRDLKPGNIMLTKSGAKLLDFGLAKETLPLAAGATLTALATRTTPVTQAGMIVGTFQYMSPEQVEAKELDARSDIFSFGSVLYEMLTGRAAFQGRSQLSVASAILEKDPEPISTLVPMTPPALDRTVRKCLQKDPDNRWQTARDLMLELKWIASAGSQAGVPAPAVSHRKNRERIAWVIAALLVIVAGAALLGPWRGAHTAPAVIRFTIPAPTGQQFAMSFGGLAISPNGEYVVFCAWTARTRDHRQLYLRYIGQDEVVPIRGTEDATNPFFSPDGQWIAFTANGKLRKVQIAGGSPITLCDKPNPGGGGTWAQDGTIYITDIDAKLFRVLQTEGKPQEVATVAHATEGEAGVRWPQALPGSQAILYVTGGSGTAGSDDARICVVSLKTGQHKTLIQGGTYPRYISTGHLVYAQGGRLLAVPFDLQRLEVTGTATPVVADVWQGGGGYSAYDVSENGSLVSVSGSEQLSFSGSLELAWLDVKGVASPINVPAHPFADPKISPDGSLVAVAVRGIDPKSDVHVFDPARGTLTRITFSKMKEFAIRPIWTRDGKRLIYASGDGRKLSWKLADGSGAEELLYSSDVSVQPSTVLPDGRLLFERGNAGGVIELWLLNLTGDRKAVPLLADRVATDMAQISPDGRWLAFRERPQPTAPDDVYVTSFPGLEGRWQISTDRGNSPLWSPDGRELFYRTDDGKVMAVDVQTKNTFKPGVPHLLFGGPYHHSVGAHDHDFDYDITPDGKHFVMLKEYDSTGESSELRVVVNWAEELKSRPGNPK